MKKNSLYLVFLALLNTLNSLFGQNEGAKYDRYCMLGSEGNSLMQVDSDSVHFTSLSMKLNFLESSTTMSDKEGNLIFYSNGISINNKAHTIMQNGNRINPGKWLEDFNFLRSGVPIFLGLLSLPMPNTQNTYMLLNTYTHDKFFTDPPMLCFCAPEFYYQNIDIDKNGGLGSLIEPNELITKGNTMDIHQMPSGVYFCSVLDNGHQLAIAKFVKTN